MLKRKLRRNGLKDSVPVFGARHTGWIEITDSGAGKLLNFAEEIYLQKMMITLLEKQSSLNDGIINENQIYSFK